MRRSSYLQCAACALLFGIVSSIEVTSISAAAEAPVSRPLSKVPPIERFGQAALDRQAQFLQRMSGVQISYGANGSVSEVKGRTGVYLSSGLASFKVDQPAKELLQKIGPALLAAGTEELRVFRVNSEAPKAKPDSPERTVRFVQYIGGREVQFSWVTISLNTQTNEIVHLLADFLPDYGLPHEPKLTAAAARAKVEAAMRDSGLEEEKKIIFEDSPARLAYTFEDSGDRGGIGGVLVWLFQASRTGDSVEVAIDALTGEVVRVGSYTTGLHFPNRQSYTANGAAPLTGFFPNGLIPTFGEGGTGPDQVSRDLYNKAGIVFGVYDLVFGRNSYDNAGSPLNLVTHYAMASPAAFAPGGYIMVADNSPATANDTDAIAHEFAHGIHQTGGGLVLSNGPVDGAPALAEAFGDWGSTVADVYLNGAVSPSTWQISSYRNLQAPTLGDPFARDWFPSRSYILGEQSRYRNSTIMGHALYLLATGGQHYRAGIPGSEVPVIPVTGIGYSAARNIFYDAINAGAVNNNATFFSMRNATVTAAPPGQQSSVQQAWNAVGVGYNCTSVPQPPFPTAWPEYCKGRYDISWPAVPGTTRYDGQITQANLGWAFAATVVDAPVTSCHQDLPKAYWMMRVRACNGCGCSAWSHTEYMQYYDPCL